MSVSTTTSMTDHERHRMSQHPMFPPTDLPVFDVRAVMSIDALRALNRFFGAFPIPPGDLGDGITALLLAEYPEPGSHVAEREITVRTVEQTIT